MIYAAVISRVLASPPKFQIGSVVVLFVMVTMMHTLVSGETPTDCQLHNSHMFVDISATSRPRMIGRICADISLTV